MSFSTPSHSTVTAGGTFLGGYVKLTCIEDAIISDNEGNVFGSYQEGISYEGNFPKGMFVVTSGSIKIWNS